MVNRELIRLKTVQLVYAHCQNRKENTDAVEEELVKSMAEAYDLYHYLLLLIVEINNIALREVEAQQNRAERLGIEDDVNTKFVKNRFVLQLEQNKQLEAYRDDTHRSWFEYEEFVRDLYRQIKNSELYKEYMASQESSYEEDREFWRKAYRQFIVDNEKLSDILEDLNLYWNDDRFVVDSFVLKTIKQLDASAGAEAALMPEFRSDQDRDYAVRLVRNAIENGDAYRELINQHSRNWDLSRLALMDIVIMQTALAEIITCPEVPVQVSISEFVEIAKAYSTPRSGSYVNAMLDNICKTLMAEKKIVKNK